jgi:hypothetical protein
VLLAVLTAAALAACSVATTGHGRAATAPGAGTATSGSTGSTGSTAPTSCPASYIAPDPKRPDVKLTFTVSDDLKTVHGTEHITFTPDRPISELVFRLTANTVPTVAEGNGITVTAASADHGGGTPAYSVDGAAPTTQGGLLHIPFAKTVAAGTTVTADLTFDVTLGLDSFDRLGRATSAGAGSACSAGSDGGGGNFGWFASAQPLLAWERGFGWHTEPMILFPAESATSEAMQTDLTVTAPAGDTVIMSGDPTAPTVDGAGRKIWHATIAAARDVSVSVGPFSVSDTVVGGVKLRVGGYTQAERDQLVPEFQRAITELSARFGPFPFSSLSVARLPAGGGGIEYPAAIQMLDSSNRVAVHETAHQWFYAMVGDSQALHPWLDEAFASYAEQLLDNDPPAPAALTEPGQVDRPTASYGSDEASYYSVTYDKGAAALHAARAAAGAAAFDAAIRCYVNANAWRIANPSDLAAALARLPAAVSVLRQAQALP